MHPAPAPGPNPGMRRFVQRMRHGRPWATWALVGIIGSVFLTQLALGATESVFMLVRMGGLTKEALQEGEPWRLLSSTFLHGGFAHVGFALMILWSLGGFIEKLLGTWRYLALYLLSGLGGGLVALFFGGAGVMVGSSGALWGVMVAQAALAYRPGGLLPEPLIEVSRSAAKKNMLLNVLVSFLPGVSLSAHLGGGLVGLVLVGSGLLTLGLDREQGAPPWVEGLIRAPVVLLSPLYLASLAAALLVGQPWALKGPPELSSRAVPGLGLQLELPTALPPADGQDALREVVSYGDFLRDPYVVEVLGIAVGAPPEEAQTRLLEDVLAQGVPEGWTPQRSRPRVWAAGGDSPALFQRYVAENEVLLDRYAVLHPPLVLRVDILRWPELPEAQVAYLSDFTRHLTPAPRTEAERAELLAMSQDPRDQGAYLALLERLLALSPDHTWALNEAAWVYATSPDDALRDGDRAVTLALRAVELLPQANSLDTLAAALAETGDFEGAVQRQGQAVDLALEEQREDYRRRLKGYEEGKPLRSVLPDPKAEAAPTPGE